MSDILERADALCIKWRNDMSVDIQNETCFYDNGNLFDLLATTKDVLPELIAECKRQQAEAARWQAVATEERCKVIMLIEKLKDVANNPDWQTRGLSKTHDEYIKQAAEELQAAAALGKPRAWPMNEKREIALETFADFIEKHLEPLPEDDVLLICKREFRDMLAEAKQSTTHQ